MFTDSIVVWRQKFEDDRLFTRADHAAGVWDVLAMDLFGDGWNQIALATMLARLPAARQDGSALLDEIYFHHAAADAADELAIFSHCHFIAGPAGTRT